jgi:hypothetical protein
MKYHVLIEQDEDAYLLPKYRRCPAAFPKVQPESKR